MNAIHLFEQHLDNFFELIQLVPSLSGKRLVCHCSKGQSHADILIKKFVEVCPNAYDRNAPEQRPPTSSELNLLAAHRQEQLSDDGSSADENVPEKGAGWTGVGSPLQVGVGYTSPGQPRAGGIRAQLAGGRSWRSLRSSLMHVARRPSLWHSRWGKSRFVPSMKLWLLSLREALSQLWLRTVLDSRDSTGAAKMSRSTSVFLGLLLSAADDSEVGKGSFAQGVRVGPGSRMPRLPALYRPKKKWRLTSQTDPRAYLEEEGHESESSWRRNYASDSAKRKPRSDSPVLSLLHLVPIGRTDRTVKLLQESFTMAPMACQ